MMPPIYISISKRHDLLLNLPTSYWQRSDLSCPTQQRYQKWSSSLYTEVNSTKYRTQCSVLGSSQTPGFALQLVLHVSLDHQNKALLKYFTLNKDLLFPPNNLNDHFLKHMGFLLITFN